MLDRTARQWLDPWLARLGRQLVQAGIHANTLTFTGFGLGLCGALLIALQSPLAGLAFIAVSRLCDGLDGTVARQTVVTDRGAYFDITLDFMFYASVPLAFAWADPARNALPAAFLLAAFMGTASSFLAFAALAARRSSEALSTPGKSFYFLGGLTEATETLLCFGLMCLFPARFPLIAGVFSALCAITILSRLQWAWKQFDPHRDL